MDWILEKLPVLVFVVVALAQIVKAVMKSRESQAEHEKGFDETEEQRRVREIQERIRRIAAERGQPSAAPAHTADTEDESLPPIMRPEQSPSGRSFDDALERGLVALERKVEAPVYAESRSAELERQAALAEQMRQLAEARELAQRRAARIATTTEAAAQSEPGMLRTLRGQLDEELRTPESLRRAFVLREVLGPPLGLR
jgi:hypothetical protein